MLSMFEGGFFGSHIPLTRFQKSRELAETLNLLKELNEKNNELGKAVEKAAANQDVDNIVFPKHKVVSDVVSILDKEINEFNKSPAFSLKKDELVDISTLVDKLIASTLPLLTDHQAILFTPRDNNRKYVNAAIEFITIGGLVTVVAFTPLPWIMVPVAFVGSSVASHYARNVTGLSNIAPKSACILFDLISKFIVIGKNVAESLGLNTQKYDEYTDQVLKICKEATENYLKQQQENSKQEHVDLSSDENSIVANPVNELLYYSRSLRDFISCLAVKPKFSDLIKDLHLPEQEEKALFSEYYDPTTGRIMNTPVRINGRLADLDATFRYPLDEKGRRTDPFNTNYIFYPMEIKPDWQAACDIEKKIHSLMTLKGEDIPHTTMRP